MIVAVVGSIIVVTSVVVIGVRVVAVVILLVVLVVIAMVVVVVLVSIVAVVEAVVVGIVVTTVVHLRDVVARAPHPAHLYVPMPPETPFAASRSWQRSVRVMTDARSSMACHKASPSCETS